MIHIRSLSDSLSGRKGTLNNFFRDNVIGQLTINQSYPNKGKILVGKLGHFYFNNPIMIQPINFWGRGRIMFAQMTLLFPITLAFNCTLKSNYRQYPISLSLKINIFFALFVICLLNVSNKSDNNH